MDIINIRDIIADFTDEDIINYFSLLNNLTNVYDDNIELNFMINNFKNYISNLPVNINIFVGIYYGKIIGSGTLIIEEKIIHSFGKVGHIEDVVIDSKFQGKGFGKKIVDFLINVSKNEFCYKTILTCDDDKIEFYEKCKPKSSNLKKSNQISYYFYNI